MGAMADLANVADIVLLMVDASIGFEMQTFEFLTLLQIKGFPRCMGVMSHMDTYKDNKKLKKMKKFFKRRFDDETTPESKLFFTGGFKNKYYLHHDVINIARFLSVILPRKTEWKKDHPHMIIDRMEVLTEGVLHDENVIDVAFFGYIRGSTFFNQPAATLVGLGKRALKELKAVEDPCPPLEKNIEQAPEPVIEGEEPEDEENGEKKKKANRSRTLELNQRVLYAPQSNVGVLAFDETGGYITIPDKFVIFTKKEGEDDPHANNEGVKMMRELHQAKQRLDLAVDEDEVELITGVPLREKELKKEFISFQSSLKMVSEIAEKAAQFEGKTASQSKFVNLVDVIYGEEGMGSLHGISDVSRYTAPELQPQKWYANHARCRFVTVILLNLGI